MNIKDRILKLLEGELELIVDKLGTSIHSAVSEKMEFMGMELKQFLLRARKKYLKRKAAKAQELKMPRDQEEETGVEDTKPLVKKLKRRACR
ncbi:hypothetical protein ACMD2_15684 [Ananas comosus]|uniref:Uncharacterized protein n=1 Tax=Ananas comosus TaxID=4615 RepID=A0A199W800_ANACO|nr:hypothetical protein ACMD2_15684 [Ananas comosus]